MIVHLVLIRLTEPDRAQEIADLLNGMQGRVPGLIEVAAGPDVSGGDASYDLGLLTRFESDEALQAYQTHPVHAEVLEVLKPLVAERAVADFHR